MAIGRALFGNSSSQAQSKNLLEFRAGKMELKGNMVHPDKRKGLIYIHQSDDSLMHFCWKDRTSGNTVDDLIIFPDDVEYKRVQQCTTGRVYVLKFKSTNRKLFFWMQEPKTDKDDEYCKKVNEYLNNPPAARSGGSTPGGLPSELSNLGDSDIQTLLNNMSQQQLVQFFGNVGGMSSVNSLSSILGNRSSAQSSRLSSANSTRSETTSTTSASVTSTTTTAAETTAVTTNVNISSTTTNVTSSAVSVTSTLTPSVGAATPAASVTTTTSTTTTTTTTPATPFPNIQLSDLQNILSGIRVPTPSEENQSRTPIDLSTAVNSEALQPILSNPDFIQRLQNFIPQADSTSGVDPEQLRDTFHSPQFQQAMSMFSAGLQSGQLGPLMQQFGLNEDAISAASQGDIETFVRALQNSLKKSSPNEKAKDKPGKDDDDDEDMALD